MSLNVPVPVFGVPDGADSGVSRTLYCELSSEGVAFRLLSLPIPLHLPLLSCSSAIADKSTLDLTKRVKERLPRAELPPSRRHQKVSQTCSVTRKEIGMALMALKASIALMAFLASIVRTYVVGYE